MSTSTSSGSAFPSPEGDSGRHHLKASNVDRVVAFLRRRVRGVVVSGVVDPHQDVDRGRLPHPRSCSAACAEARTNSGDGSASEGQGSLK